jgi:anti-sigma regulatory factor (Ser/Thr protein kinase)/predicted transcriptional regulator
MHAAEVSDRGARAAQIVAFILQNVESHPGDVVRLAGERYGISRQMVNRYVDLLVSKGLLEAQGKTRARQYTLRCIVDAHYTVALDADTSEDEVWRRCVGPHLAGLPKNVWKICEFGFTEMFNNAIEHSEAAKARVLVQTDAAKVRLMVFDYGMGIFNKLARDLHLADARFALMELLKGKLTTAQSSHSGQGIFFTARAFDRFTLASGRLRFTHLKEDDSFRAVVEGRELDSKGTTVDMQISVSSPTTLSAVFDRFSTSDVEGFGRTHVYVKLAGYEGESLVSRSQARRMVARFEEFDEVELDFENVETIGQAFADEVFRVFRANHPGVRLLPRNTSPEVSKMILWAEAGQSAEQPRLL